MSARILYINPLGSDEFDKPILDFLEKGKRDETEVAVESLSKGPEHVEYRYYESLVIPEMLHRIKRAENDGYDGAIIGCFYDPGLYAAKEITSRMVVTAPAEAAMLIASTLGYRFSIIVGRYSWVTIMEENVVKYGFERRLASFKWLDLGVLDFHRDEEETKKRMRKLAKEAVEKDRAEVVILGCTIEFGFYEELQNELGVPVLDAVLSSLKYAEFLIEIKKKLNWGLSKVGAFVMPPKKEIKDFKLEEQYGTGNLWI
jgi:allantoin racemase